MSKRKSARVIADEWVTGGDSWSLWVNDDNSVSLETIQTAALLDIARSLRHLLTLANCPNVAAGYRGMASLGKVLDRQESRVLRALRTRNRNLRAKLKAAVEGKR